MANFSLGVEVTTDHVINTEGGESMGEIGMGEHHHETHFRGMDMPGDDSGNNIFNFSWHL